MTQEQLLANNAVEQYTLDLNNIDSQLSRLQEAAKVYANASPDAQEKLKGTMAQVLEQYNNLKVQRNAVASNLITATNQLEEANALANQQVIQQVPSGNKRRAATEIPSTDAPETIVEEQPIVDPYANWRSFGGAKISPDGTSYVRPDGSIVIGIPEIPNRRVSVDRYAPSQSSASLYRGHPTLMDRYNNTLNNISNWATNTSKNALYASLHPIKAGWNYVNGRPVDYTNYNAYDQTVKDINNKIANIPNNLGLTR